MPISYRRAMSSSVAILRPAGESLGFDARWPKVLQLLRKALETEGLVVDDRAWTEDVDSLSAFDLILPLLVWGYQHDRAWQGRVRGWQEAGLPLCNPASVLAWNADKSYLGRLAEAGAPVVPTLFEPRVDEEVLEAAAAQLGSDRLVAKPTISAGAYQTIRWSPGERLAHGPSAAALIQPYLPAIEEQGEISLIYLGGTFSHAIRKVPQQGDFRVQPEFDGILSRYSPTSEELTAAEVVLGAVSEELLYARVDLVRGPAGEPLLMELELIEPDLSLEFDPAASKRFGQAVARSVRPVEHRLRDFS